MEPRKILTLKKKPAPEVTPEPIIDKKALKAAKKAANAQRSKVAQGLQSRLHVHKKATTDLKTAKHPMRIMTLNKMLDRLNRHILKDNGLLVSYNEKGEQILTEVVKTENSVI